jgi:hypothetical protein
MGDLRYRAGPANATRGCCTLERAREEMHNRLCELRREPAFAEWLRLTTALGLEECLAVLASEALEALPEGASAQTVAALSRAARQLDRRARPEEDSWLNPLLPLPLAGAGATLAPALALAAGDGGVPIEAASAD